MKQTVFTIEKMCGAWRFWLPAALVTVACLTAKGQSAGGYFTVSGTVRDAYSKKKVEAVNVSLAGTHIGTITNSDGEFVLKAPVAVQSKEIVFSCLGYYNAKVTVSREGMQKRTFYITPKSVQLDEVDVFSWQDPRALVEAAMEKVAHNYGGQPALLTGFYRETIQKRSKYINISEAVVRLYKSPYLQTGVENDRVQILKGRKLVSPKASDTLSVKFLGGPNMAIYTDVVKNPDLLLSKEALSYYAYKMGEAATVDDRLQYVVHFQPQVIVSTPLYAGAFYIDRETLTLTRAEFAMDMKDKLKATGVILKNRPAGLRFTPEEVSYVTTYRLHDGIACLNYVRNEIRFRCDWRRRLFATHYTIVDETVVTDIQTGEVTKIAVKDAFSSRQSLSREVSAYFDEDFWGAYNIIEPAESLENAVNKLKKQQP